MSKYLDLLITDNDLTPDVAGNPLLTTDRDVIAQDIIHMIKELGYLPPLVANRNQGLIERTKVEITMAVDNDYRIVPGSTFIEEPDPGTFYLVAQTLEFGSIEIYLGV
ncbi:DUF2590 family protein [Desulfosediminicola sp.]|uniref:DUF2590 family protein n=1 Tax=Desulfosediminicola sp. TaxID=2886825 RepID=UPI003AF20C07